MTRSRQSQRPGYARRQDMTPEELFELFPDDAAAERWFIRTRWPKGVRCPYCSSCRVQEGAAHRTMPLRCRGCRRRFSVRTGTVMQAANLGYQIWAVAIYLLTTRHTGISSVELHRYLARTASWTKGREEAQQVTQKAAWHLAHRLRAVFQEIDRRGTPRQPGELAEMEDAGGQDPEPEQPGVGAEVEEGGDRCPEPERPDCVIVTGDFRLDEDDEGEWWTI